MNSKIIDIDLDFKVRIEHEDGSPAQPDELALIESVLGGLLHELVAMSEEK